MEIRYFIGMYRLKVVSSVGFKESQIVILDHKLSQLMNGDDVVRPGGLGECAKFILAEGLKMVISGRKGKILMNLVHFDFNPSSIHMTWRFVV